MFECGLGAVAGRGDHDAAEAIVAVLQGEAVALVLVEEALGAAFGVGGGDDGELVEWALVRDVWPNMDLDELTDAAPGS